MEEQGEKLMCQFCKKTYTSQGNWNRHMRIFHPKLVTAELKPKTRRIICPLCSQQESFLTHIIFRKHLSEAHNIDIKVSTLNFMNLDEFQVWRTQSGREENYSHSMKHVKRIVYHCIRSNCRGYESKSTTCQPKSGGSKFINGVCPSRIVAKIANTGEVLVEFVETHVGHEDEIGCKSLTKAEEGKIRDQLTAGVPVDKIIHDARVVENKTLKRMNLLSRVDLNRIIKKYNIDHPPMTTPNENKPIHLKDNIRGINQGSTSEEEQNITSTTDLKIAELFKMAKFCKQLDPCVVDHVHQNFANMLRQFGMKTENMKGICQKRKTEKQTYFPNKKMKRN